MKKRILKKLSFTLIELLVTVFIIAILSASSVPLVRNIQKSNELSAVAYEVRSAILEAKGYSLAPRVNGTKVGFYEINFYKGGENNRNYYEIAECPKPISSENAACQDEGVVKIDESFRILPKDISFNFIFPDGNSNSAVARIIFSVEEQGKIIFPVPSANNSNFKIEIRRGTEKIDIEVNLITGAVDVNR